LSPGQQAEELCQLLRENMAADPRGHKIIVFFTTARLTQFYAELCNLMGFPVLEIHSRKSQGHRNKVSDQFRNGQGLVMFTSDVSARGMDYPDVSAVIQVMSLIRTVGAKVDEQERVALFCFASDERGTMSSAGVER
ncbi:unnamed protein product, partial [Hapterophycus canaliculatus]